MNTPPAQSSPHQSLAGAYAVVTGGSGVLGGATCRALARAGAQVAIIGRNQERARGVAQSIEEMGGQARVLIADVTDTHQISAAVDQLAEHWGCVDVLVNAAGGHVAGALAEEGDDLTDVSEDALREVVDLNFRTSVSVTRALLPLLRRDGALPTASVINFSSMTAGRAISRVLGYGASKAAVENLTRWLAQHLASDQRCIRVNAISPGFFLAQTNRSLLETENGLTARGEHIVAHTPMGRLGEPDEIGGAVVFLSSPSASFITGVVLPVDGGFSSWSGV